jgi:Protein of unknown function (DUF1203)
VFGRGMTRHRAVMNSTFRITGLPLENFARLFSLNDDELRKKNARRLTVDVKPGFPCRVSLQDAEIGEHVILLPFAHHDVDSPYRASGAIFVREAAQEINLASGELPDVVRNRVLSVRAYDHHEMMVNGLVAPGAELKSEIEKLFADLNISYLHLHNAGAGCYSCRVERV